MPVALNPRSPVPLYRQLASKLVADIDSGIHKISTRIPSENVLADQFEIGRPTVRQATDLLVRQGRLERRRGSGTFVLPPTRSIDLFSLAGTSAAFQNSDVESSLLVVQKPVLSDLAPSILQTKDGLPFSTPTDTQLNKITDDHMPDTELSYWRIERRATVDDVPVLYETLWFSASVFQDLNKHSVSNRSLSGLVRDVYFLEATSAEQTFYVMQADLIKSNHLNVELGTPLLRVNRTLNFGDHKAALHAEIVCRTDQFEFSQTLYPGSPQ